MFWNLLPLTCLFNQKTKQENRFYIRVSIINDIIHENIFYIIVYVINVLVPKIALTLLEEQAKKISNKNKVKFVFRVLVHSFGFKNFISKEEINTHKPI